MIVGIAMVKDEVDIVGQVVTHMLGQVDQVIVADNGSTDGTREILAALPITLIDDPEPGYYQSRKMTRLAHQAREEGATWVVPFDADEWWYWPFGRIGDHLADVAPQWFAVSADLYDHVATGEDDPEETDPIRRLGWRRRDKLPLPKVACRTSPDLVIEQGNHAATFPGGTTIAPGFVVRHFPRRSPDQYVKKIRNGAAAYAATDLPDDMGAHWRQHGQLLADQGPDVLHDIFYEHFFTRSPRHDSALIFDPAP